MPYLVIAVQFLSIYWLTTHLVYRMVDDKGFGPRTMWASLAVLAGMVITALASALGVDSTALGINASMLTWTSASVVGIITVAVLEFAGRIVFKNLHQLT